MDSRPIQIKNSVDGCEDAINTLVQEEETFVDTELLGLCGGCVEKRDQIPSLTGDGGEGCLGVSSACASRFDVLLLPPGLLVPEFSTVLNSIPLRTFHTDC